MTKTGAKAGIMPAGSDPVRGVLPDGKHKITIMRLSENNEMRVRYPCGWERDHQAKDIQELAPKLVNNLRARYGVESVNILNAPALEEGAVIEVEVGNGA